MKLFANGDIYRDDYVILIKQKNISKIVTKQPCFGKFPDIPNLTFLLRHRHFHYDVVIIIMSYVSSINSTICHHFTVLHYMLYNPSYCTDNLPQEK